MAECFCCFRCCFDGAGFRHIPLRELPLVKLDTSQMGNDVVIVKNGRRICGTGAALANAPLVQDKAYFEVKIQSSGSWGVGLATQKCNVNKVPQGNCTESWVLRHDGRIFHDSQEKGKLSVLPEEGDIVGLSYDHIELNFFVNGTSANCPITGIKGTTFPLLYVDDGAVLDVQFDKFYHQPPDSFNPIMIEQSLL
ncbi:SPRY domain-containing protein 7-like [Gigantopelta aegis]|uniref:SPRY domain-containing protein 7-like n=1 Tax=Gigantopelta aegis TaxID=1735272 RepID=UPI001B88DB5A|nr:SPRY domain-containing protein 7-like [Gigantopelta aegis]